MRDFGPVIALGYARCSTQEQADAGNGLAAQEKAIRAECERRGWQLLDVARDEGPLRQEPRPPRPPRRAAADR